MSVLSLVSAPEKTMTSLEIAELTGKQHSHVLRDIRAAIPAIYAADHGSWDVRSYDWSNASPKDCDRFLDSLDITGVFVERRKDTGQTKAIHLDRYHTEVLVTGYDVKRRAAVIKRWHDLETGAATPAFDIPKNYQDALRLAADLEEERHQLQTTLERNQPKVDFANQVATTTGCVTVGEFAKMIGTGQNLLFAWLRDNKFLFNSASSKNLPYQKHLDAGRFTVIERPITIRHSDGTVEDVMKTKTLITGKGQAYIYRKWKEAA